MRNDLSRHRSDLNESPEVSAERSLNSVTAMTQSVGSRDAPVVPFAETPTSHPAPERPIRKKKNYLKNLYTFVLGNSEREEVRDQVADKIASIDSLDLICDTSPSTEINVVSSTHEQAVSETELNLLSRVPRFDIEASRIHLYAQAIHSKDGAYSKHVEVISRIESFDGSILFPRKFMPRLIEQSLCFDFDQIVLEKLFKHYALRSFLYSPLELYSISLCEQTIRDERFFDELIRLAGVYEFDLGRLCFTIDAHIVDSDIVFFQAFSKRVLALGCHIAALVKTVPSFDLIALSDMNLDYIKLSARCLDRIQTRTSMNDAMHELVQKCEALDMPVVAEQVDRRSLKSLVDKLGISLLQGFLVSPPVHIDWVNVE